MSEPVKKKGRIRSADLAKSCRGGNEIRYDFKKATQLKSVHRDPRNTGRPAGVASLVRGHDQSQQGVLNCEPLQPSPCTNSATEVISDTGTTTCPSVFGAECSAHLTEEETYRSLLKEKAAVYCLDDKYLSFVLQDFDSTRNQLKAWKFQNVSRRAISFVDGDIQWVYSCSCSQSTKELIDCCEDNMEVPFPNFKARIADCLHTRSLSIMLESFDAKNQITPEVISNDEPESPELENEEPTEEGYVVLKDGLYGVNSSKGYGIVQRSSEGYKCLTCQSMKNRCIHLTVFINLHGEDFSTKSLKVPYRQKCYSSKKIPFQSTNSLKEVYKKPLSERFPEGNTAITLKPDEVICDECHSFLEEAEQISGRIYATHQILPAIVSSKKCPSCKRQYHFDGISVCVLNMGKNLFCHEIMRKFMYYFLTGKTTIFTEYTVLQRTFHDCGFHEIDEMSYQDFKEAWYAFLDLLDIDFQDSFQCPKCGPSPGTVVMDATSVAFRKELISWQSMFSTDYKDVEPYDKIDPARVKERTLCSRIVRALLMDFAKPNKGLNIDQKKRILHLLRIENESEELISLFNVIFQDSVSKGDRIFVSDRWRDFVQILSSPCPLCSFFPPCEDFFSFLKDTFLQREKLLQNDVYLKRLQTTVPVIFRMIMTMRGQFPFIEFQNCLQYFQQKVFDPFLKDPCPSEEEPDEDDPLSFFPSLQNVRKRGVFVADKKGLKGKQDLCTKFSKGHPSLLPGVFTLFCPHGICYGFQVMKVHESPDVPFTLLRTRFKDAPKLVVYDNACTLQVYCLNRDPTFFHETEFRVDGLHFKNHKACGPSFDLKSYPQYVALNSQVVEQSNARLQRIKGSLSYMTQSNFMKHCKFYLWGQNNEVISKLI